MWQQATSETSRLSYIFHEELVVYIHCFFKFGWGKVDILQILGSYLFFGDIVWRYAPVFFFCMVLWGIEPRFLVISLLFTILCTSLRMKPHGNSKGICTGDVLLVLVGRKKNTSRKRNLCCHDICKAYRMKGVDQPRQTNQMYIKKEKDLY